MNLQQSLALLSQGRSILPVLPTKLPDLKYIKEWKTFMDRKPTVAEVTAWHHTEPDRNIGIITGKISGITVVDLDLGAETYKNFPKTFCVRTGSGGYHLYYKYANVPSQGLRERHVDVKNDGGYVLAPFCKTQDSANKKGGLYDIVHNNPMVDFPIHMFNGGEKEKVVWQELTAGVQEGGRTDAAKKVVGKLLYAFKNPADWESNVWPMFKNWNKSNNPPIEENVLRILFQNIAAKQAKQNRESQIEFKEEAIQDELINLQTASDEHAKTLTNEIISTGVEVLDDMLSGGFRLEHVGVISGYTGQGKSLFAMQITSHAIKQQIPVLWFQFELPPTEFWEKYKVLGITQDMPIYVPKAYKTASMDWVESMIILGLEKGIKIVVFDLLDFLQEGDKKSQDKNGEDSAILIRLKKIATQYKISIILMAHARKPGQHGNAPPNIHDIRGTGNIGGIANWAMIVHRIPKKKTITEFADEEYTPYFSFKVAKNRINGRIYTFYGEYINNVLHLVSADVVSNAVGAGNSVASHRLQTIKNDIEVINKPLGTF